MGLFDKLRKKPTPRQFATLVLKQIRTAGYTSEFEYDAERFLLRGDDRRVINLANFYHQYCETPHSKRQQQLQMSVMAILQDFELPEDFSDALPDIRPRIWSRAAIESIDLRQRLETAPAEDADFAGQLVGDHLWCSIAYDLPWSVRSVNRSEIEKWDVSFYEALESGRRNLDELTSQYAKIGDGFYSFVHGDTYDASRLMLIDKIRDLEVDGQHVVMVPNRDTILITGSQDTEGLTTLARIARKSIEDAYTLVPLPLILDGDQWIDWIPPDDHPAREDFKYLEGWYFTGEYQSQKDLLDAIHENEGTDIFVAKYSAVQGKGDRIASYCVWSEGVDSLLPRTDHVLFFQPEKQVSASGTWDSVWNAVGHLMIEQDELYPPRYRVRDFPNANQLQQVGMLEEYKT